VGITLAALLFLWLVPRGRHEPAPEGETTLQRLRRTGVARVGYANEAPYAFVGNDGGLTGEAPEIARQILQGLGVASIEGVLTEFGSLIPGLEAGRFDLIAAGMYITPERCREIAFSEPTYSIGEAFIVAVSNPLELHGYQDVAANADATLGVVAGTVERNYARLMGIPDERVVVFPDPPSAVAGVAAGRVDAYAGTRLTIRDLLSKSSGDALVMASPFHEPTVDGEVLRGYGAFGFRQENEELRRAFNRALEDFIGSEAHLALVAPFGFTAEELPGDVTTTQLCTD
jgi:polar amino acid transport system substrate-binding protein